MKIIHNKALFKSRFKSNHLVGFLTGRQFLTVSMELDFRPCHFSLTIIVFKMIYHTLTISDIQVPLAGVKTLLSY